MTVVHLSCPVCGESLEYRHDEPDAWGSLSITDWACVEITAHDKGRIRQHMNLHWDDGSWWRLQEQRLENEIKARQRVLDSMRGYYATKEKKAA